MYHLSNKNYGFLLSRVWYIVQNGLAILQRVERPYVASNEMVHYGLPPLRTPICPDLRIQYVAGTACPYYPSASQATLNNYLMALDQGYETQLLMGVAASRQNYLDYMSCTDMGGFNNIGHGDQSAIILYDGVLTYQDFAQINFESTTSILFNSCQVMNPPLSDVMNKNGARFYAGGVSTLLIGFSEPVTTCFWNATFHDANMTAALTKCATLDPLDTWGSEDPSGHQRWEP